MITEESTKVSSLSCGVVIQRHDIATTHEEGGNIIMQQAMQVTVIEQKHVSWNCLLKRER